ncbi:MAG: hypothetical protein AAGD38_01755 [Acidobacteriota bacterium]
MIRSKTCRLVLLTFCACLVLPNASAEASRIKNLWKTVAPTVKKVGEFVMTTTIGVGTGQAYEILTGQDPETELRRLLPEILDEIAVTTGPEREWIQAQLEAVETQIDLVQYAQDIARGDIEVTQADLDALRSDQQRLLSDLDYLEGRVDRLEVDMAELRSRVDFLEDVYIRDCLDLRTAPRVGIEGFAHRETPRNTHMRDDDGQGIAARTRLLLDACTPDLTQRGLLVQLVLTTFDLREEISLLVTFKDLRLGGFDSTTLNHLSRFEYPLYQPRYAIDGQVQELFIPYDQMPFSASSQVVIAFVLAHDRRPIYSIPDQVITCLPGRQVTCRWGR